MTKQQGRKKQTKRSRAKYPALKPELNLKTRYEEIADVAEYADTLPEDAKEWLNKFMNEYTNDVLDRKNLKKNLHNTKKLKQDCDARNNARNRDLYTRMKASGTTVYIEDLKAHYIEIEKNQLDEIELEDFQTDFEEPEFNG